MDSLAMDDVPAVGLADHRGNLRSEIVIALTRPCRDAEHSYAFQDLRPRTLASPVGGQHCDIEPIKGGEPASHLVYVHLDAAEIRQVARAHHQDSQGAIGSQASSSLREVSLNVARSHRNTSLSHQRRPPTT